MDLNRYNTRSIAPFSMYRDNSVRCVRSKQQIMGGLRLHKICGWPAGQPNIDCWPKGPAKVCRPRNEAAVKRLIIMKIELGSFGDKNT